MTVQSMTGFARTTFTAGGQRYACEAKSVNARGLEIRLRLGPGLDALESDLRQRCRNALVRGSIFLSVTPEEGQTRRALRVDEEALSRAVVVAKRLVEEFGIALPTADGLLALPGILVDSSPRESGDDDAAERDSAILDGVDDALAALRTARLEEGARLDAVLRDQLSTVERLTGLASNIAGEAPAVLKKRIADAVAQLTEATSSLDPDRLHQEAVLAATRADPREELDRLTAHVAGARERLDSGGAIGRRLDFLAQEFNREANTLCSKSFDRRLTDVGLELKAVIDQFREQVQNVE
ncbi:TIGR00255 family protein [Faunimonas pinastri]|uniref:TIGR00255 family protein n=1 Tax=Faunimonas pinastri TaxID=1855383 RepID=A0A1H9DBU4_9HYPH|nr:YicC/YloC family endoribonuclease [Faunimonas pinastri]SEQ11032.1 TIGR00255 family protein [Faunimonas pinastri]